MGLRFDEICIDAADPTALGTWWSQAVGWPQDVDEDGDVRLTAPPGSGPNWMFLRVVLADPEGNEFCVLTEHG